MSFAADMPAPWPLVPDWSEPVTETLEWLTDVLQASRTASSQHRALRATPRRGFTWRSLAEGQDRRLADLLLADRGGRTWRVPVWPDVQVLDSALSASADELPCRTEGFDFTAPGSALLWRSPREWGVVEISAIDVDGLQLSETSPSSWPVGTLLLPLRAGRIGEAPEEQALTDEVGARNSVAANVIEPCDWPAAMPTAAAYRALPVLEWRPDESEPPTSSAPRMLGVVDNETAPPVITDMIDRALRAQGHSWLLQGREAQGAWRSMLYALAGRANPVWVPSWTADLRVVAAIAAAATFITVEWTGYTLFGRQQAGLRDLRIELWNGTAFCRRITGSVQGAETETLQLDAALGQAVAIADVRQVSWLRLCTLASDTVELRHLTDADGISQCRLAFSEVAE